MKEFIDFVAFVEWESKNSDFFSPDGFLFLSGLPIESKTTAVSKEEFRNRFVEILKIGVDESLFDDQETIDEQWIEVGEFNRELQDLYREIMNKSLNSFELQDIFNYALKKREVYEIKEFPSGKRNEYIQFEESTLNAMGVFDKYKEKLMSEEMLQFLLNAKKSLDFTSIRLNFPYLCMKSAFADCYHPAKMQYEEELRLEAEESHRKELEMKHQQAEQIKASINDIGIPLTILEWDEIIDSIYQAGDLNENKKEMIRATQGEIPDYITAQLLAYALSNEDKEFIQYMQERTDFIYNVPLCDYMAEKYGADTLERLKGLLVEIEAENNETKEQDKPKIRKR